MTPTDAFIARWQNASGTELANAQSFVGELAVLLGAERPDPAQADTADNAYVFERRVIFRHGDGGSSEGRIDCYKRGCFVLEAKKIKLALPVGADNTPSASFSPSPLVGEGRGEGAGPRANGRATPLPSPLPQGERGLVRPLTKKSSFDDALLRARGQAENYARALPAAEGRPPFLIVVDVGHVIELYADFTRSGATYTPFPDPRSHRIRLADLHDEKIRARLRAVWLEPLTLDPTSVSAKVTREIAAHLAEVAKSLEQSGFDAETVAGFLTRCLFSMFAEDVKLIPKGSFTELLTTLRDNPAQFVPLVGALWREMDVGGFSVVLRQTLPRFNGKLFKSPTVLPLTKAQIDLLIEASKADWTLVEPAIFGTLLERALSTTERHSLGAHYTPRAYVERLVLPAVIEPLRANWQSVQAAAVMLANEGKDKAAIAELKDFHHRLCHLRVLDPACGSGNFLYVTLEHMKRLEGEVLNQLADIGAGQAMLETEGFAVDPHQFLGLEINPRAAAITELVLWIGYLQWHFRTNGSGLPPSPILKDFHNIVCKDAVLDYDGVEYVCDEQGKPLTRWDGRTLKTHPVTGKAVPDESARIPVERYLNPRRATWPDADVVVGNPPFIGASTMRLALGDGYVDALRGAWRTVPESADFVMFWWHHAAQLVAHGQLSSFGFITTNSLRQTFNRRVEAALNPPVTLKPATTVAPATSSVIPATSSVIPATSSVIPATSSVIPATSSVIPAKAGIQHSERRSVTALDSRLRGNDGMLHLSFAIPDHPWVDSADGAAVRIAMTVAAPGVGTGRLCTVIAEREGDDSETEVDLIERSGVIHADLSIGANVAAAQALRANSGISSPGFKLHGAGFIVTPDEAAGLEADAPIKPYRNGKDLTDRPRGVKLIDLFGHEVNEVRRRWPATYQRVLERVKPERDHNNRATYRDNWWIFGEPRKDLRPALAGLPRYIATVETSKHRSFQFLDAAIAPDNKLICFALDDAYLLGVLSSRTHTSWALAQGSWLGVGNDPVYVKSRCFETFPFPAVTPAQQAHIRDLAEQLDAHRKRVLAEHADLTLTGLYNVLEKLRQVSSAVSPVGAGDTPSFMPLSAKEKKIHERGLVGVLKSLHDELDAAVLEAYGWNDQPDEASILDRLVQLNSERLAEEAQGQIRWLRPEFQAPASGSGSNATPARPGVQSTLLEADTASPAASAPQPAANAAAWPGTLPEQLAAIAKLLATTSAPQTEAQLAQHFGSQSKPNPKATSRLPDLLAALAALGRARRLVDGRWMG